MSTHLCIAVVEDNELLREEMVSFLTRDQWQAHGVDCGEELNRWLMTHTPDIAVLDINLPYEDGYSIAARLRARHPDLGIVMLTARVRHTERSAGYEAGADVYLTKPTSARELSAVIGNLSRRLPNTMKAPPICCWLDSKKKQLVMPAGATVSLTEREHQLLGLLSFAPNQSMTYESLVDGMVGAEERAFTVEALMVLVSRFRKKLRDEQLDDRLISAAWGKGYHLTQLLRPL